MQLQPTPQQPQWPELLREALDNVKEGDFTTARMRLDAAFEYAAIDAEHGSELIGENLKVQPEAAEHMSRPWMLLAKDAQLRLIPVVDELESAGVGPRASDGPLSSVLQSIIDRAQDAFLHFDEFAANPALGNRRAALRAFLALAAQLRTWPFPEDHR